MSIIIRKYEQKDLEEMRIIWNTVVEEGNAFPQETPMNTETAAAFFSEQSYCGVAADNDEVVGLYILHPNNVGRCGHIANSSYAVKSGRRGMQIGEKLVTDSINVAAMLSFRILQFNAVVASNLGAIHLYEKLGFIRLGTIAEGFHTDDGEYIDIIPFYLPLQQRE